MTGGTARRPRLTLFGGFLGSGKTTLMLALARRLIERGRTVGVVTNDQGETLVDTGFATAWGIEAAEVGGGCFCCNFSDFVSNITGLLERRSPEFIFAEPVGSCTDLAATVLSPLALYHGDLVELCGYYVLADGPRLAGEYRKLHLREPVTPRETLLAHQLREAPHLLLTKTDLLSETELRLAHETLAAVAPDTPITPVSVHDQTAHADSMAELASAIETGAAMELPAALDIDYEVYATAEAEMGWYNGLVELESEHDLHPDELATTFLLELRSTPDLETLHAKVLVTTPTGSVKASLVDGRIQADAALNSSAARSPGSSADRARPSPTGSRRFSMTTNVRAATDKDRLAELVSSHVTELARRLDLAIVDYTYKALIPGKPVPEHRFEPTEDPLE